MTDSKYFEIYNKHEDAVKKRDLMFQGLYLDELIDEGYKLPLQKLEILFPEVEVYTSNEDTAQLLIDANIENMLIFLMQMTKLDKTEDIKYALFYIPKSNSDCNAFNTTRKIGSTTINSTFLFSNWSDASKLPETQLFKTLTNEILCDRWGADTPEIKFTSEYQQYTAAFTTLIGEVLRVYLEKHHESKINSWSLEQFYEVFRAIDAHIGAGGLNQQQIHKMLCLDFKDYDYAKHKKLYNIDNKGYMSVRVDRLCEELQNMKNNIGFSAFDYIVSSTNMIEVRFKH